MLVISLSGNLASQQQFFLSLVFSNKNQVLYRCSVFQVLCHTLAMTTRDENGQLTDFYYAYTLYDRYVRLKRITMIMECFNIGNKLFFSFFLIR